MTAAKSGTVATMVILVIIITNQGVFEVIGQGKQEVVGVSLIGTGTGPGDISVATNLLAVGQGDDCDGGTLVVTSAVKCGGSGSINATAVA